MTENFLERIENALNDIQKIQTIFRQRYGEECLADKEIEEVLKIAKKEHEEIQQYRSIGAVEECREAMAKQRRKKPEHFHKKYGKHKWRRMENGEIDECAWDFGNHNGVACEICGETVCVLCNPNYDELYDCEE